MLKLDTENKKVGLVIDGNFLNKQEVEILREFLLKKIGRESDPDKLFEMTAQLTQLNSAITTLEQVEEARRQVTAAREQNRRQEISIAQKGQREFQINCDMITSSVFERASKQPVNQIPHDDLPLYQSQISGYYALLVEKLGFEQAAKQADEILTASVQRRDWREVVELPKFNYRPRRQTITY